MLNRKMLFRGRAFTLIELLVVVAIIAILVGILLPALAEAKRSGRKAQCESNQHQFELAMVGYASDFKDLLYSFTMTAATNPVGAPAGDRLQMARNEAVQILRERGRDDMAPWITDAWFPHAIYGHLIINNYLQQRLPERMVVCPEDRQRLMWQAANDPAGNYSDFQSLSPSDRPNPVVLSQKERLPYSSSYFQMPAEWSPDLNTNGSFVYQDTSVTHYQFYFVGINNLPLGTRRVSEIYYPADKVYLAEEFGRHAGKFQTYYAYPDSVQTAAFFDGSVRDVRTGSTNWGFNPVAPTNYAYPAGVTRFNYTPQSYEPPARSSGFGVDVVVGYYRWTRAGLRGRDANGREVSSGGTPPPGGGGAP